MRYEGQVKARQQRELAESIISKITKELENPKTLQQILQQSVADVESKAIESVFIPLNTADLVFQELLLRSRNEPRGYPVHTAVPCVQNLFEDLS